jgi:hypothetical protein
MIDQTVEARDPILETPRMNALRSLLCMDPLVQRV